MNASDPAEALRVPLGKEKITVKDDSLPNTAIVTVEAEDHTLGNLLRSELLKNKQVLFVGYKMPHPLENRFVLRLQTRDSTTPRQALDEALTSLLAQVDALERNAQDAFERYRATTGY